MDQIIFSAMAGAVSGFILGLAIIVSLIAIGSLNESTMGDKYGTAVLIVLTAIGILAGLAYGMINTGRNKLHSR
ncbi:MAG TPA: hypothetical protein VGK13_01870 [Methanocellaceae archaeon]